MAGHLDLHQTGLAHLVEEGHDRSQAIVLAVHHLFDARLEVAERAEDLAVARVGWRIEWADHAHVGKDGTVVILVVVLNLRDDAQLVVALFQHQLALEVDQLHSLIVIQVFLVQLQRLVQRREQQRQRRQPLLAVHHLQPLDRQGVSGLVDADD